MARLTREDLKRLRDEQFDPESDISRLLDMIQDYEKAITWNVTCLNCSDLLDKLYVAEMRLEEAQQVPGRKPIKWDGEEF